jgi:hypothetical protein
MFITHSYAGTLHGKYRCLFFFVLEDYVEAQTAFVRELDLQLERLGRNLKDAGAVVRPFSGDIDVTRQDVLAKNWTNAELAKVGDTPGLLMINVDFDEFDPRKHPWLHLAFAGALREGKTPAGEFKDLLGDLAEAIKRSNEDVFTAARAVVYEVGLHEVAEIFEVSPEIFGISIDLAKGAALLGKLRKRLGA